MSFELFKSDHAKAVAIGAGVIALIIASCVFEPLELLLIALVLTALGLAAAWGIGWMILELYREWDR